MKCSRRQLPLLRAFSCRCLEVARFCNSKVKFVWLTLSRQGLDFNLKIQRSAMVSTDDRDAFTMLC